MGRQEFALGGYSPTGMGDGTSGESINLGTQKLKMPGAPCFVLGPLTDFRGPTLISVTYYRKWIRVLCRVVFSALVPGTDLNQAFR